MSSTRVLPPAGVRVPGRSGVGLGLAVLGLAVWIGFSGAQGSVMALAVILAPVVLGAILWNPSVGLFVSLACIPIAFSAPGGMLFRVVNYLLPVLILASWFLRLPDPTLRNRFPEGLRRWMFAYILWVVFASMFSAAPMSGLVVAVRFLVLGALLIVFSQGLTLRDLGRGTLIYAAVLIPIGVSAIWTTATEGVVGLLNSQLGSPERVSAIYKNPNTFGLLMAHGLTIHLAYFMRPGAPGGGWTRLGRSTAGLLIALVFAGGLLVSLSRASGIYALVTFGILVWFHRTLRWMFLGTLLLAGGFLLLIPLPSWLMAGLRVGSGLSFRTDLWLAGLRILREHPWTGIGTGDGVFESYRSWYLSHSAHLGLIPSPGGAAHNVYITKGAELGVVGFVLVLVLFGWLWTKVPGALRRYRQGDWVSGLGAVGVVGLTIHGIFESGSTLENGRLTDTLMFFLFALILSRTGEDPVPGREALREGDAGGGI